MKRYPFDLPFDSTLRVNDLDCVWWSSSIGAVRLDIPTMLLKTADAGPLATSAPTQPCSPTTQSPPVSHSTNSLDAPSTLLASENLPVE